ncbi:MAG: hypothetical protein ACRC8A_06820 [Microcoleaceae cyanobacterium]
MTREISPFETQAELDLLDALFQPEQLYPINPLEPEAEARLSQLEERFSVTDCLTDAEVLEKSQTLLTHIDRLWLIPQLQKSLQQRFAQCMPRHLLYQLVQKGVEMAASGVSFADQLVQSAQAALPQWQEEDLWVLARPFAYAMRGDTSPESALATMQSRDWADLSEVEQARVSLMIACAALSELAALEQD